MYHLPSMYLITPDFDGDTSGFLTCLEQSLQCGIRLVQLRSKNLPINEFVQLAQLVAPLVHAFEGKIILNQSPLLLDCVNADGIHYPSMAHLAEHKRPIANDFLLSVACHNQEQLQHAEWINADIAVLSPVFSSSSCPKGVPLGWSQFSQLVAKVSLPVYALGGLSLNDYKIAKQHGAFGIAAKRALWNLSLMLPGDEPI